MPLIVAKQRHFVTPSLNRNSNQLVGSQSTASGGGINSSSYSLAANAEGRAQKYFDDQLHRDIEEVLSSSAIFISVSQATMQLQQQRAHPTHVFVAWIQSALTSSRPIMHTSYAAACRDERRRTSRGLRRAKGLAA